MILPGNEPYGVEILPQFGGVHNQKRQAINVIQILRPSGRLAGVCLALAFATGVAACSTAEGTSQEGSASSAAVVAESTANVDRYFANNGAPLVVSPASNPGALKGKTLMYLSAGISSPSGTAGVAALEKIRDQLGFNLVTFDGQFTPSKYQDGLRQAVAQKVDALIVYGISCAGNEAALREVRAAGIKVIGLQSADCNESDPNAQALFDAQPLYPSKDSEVKGSAVWGANGAAQADYLISQLKGDVKVIQFDVPDFAVSAALGSYFEERMAACSTCEIVEKIDVAVADFGPGLQQKAEQALLKHPEANAVAINYDDLVTLGLSAAIQSSGRKNDLLAIAGTGYEATLDMIRQGNGLAAGWVQNHEWDHYAGVDTVLRALAGQTPEVSGIPTILYDKNHNLPKSGAFIPATDFRSVFEQAWTPA